jgi:lysophospholipid hydrolase
LKELPRRDTLKYSDGYDLHPDLNYFDDLRGGNGGGGGKAEGLFHNYLDEFLSAIKVFGYLEKPVFHELAKHLQTRRLIKGDCLDLSKDKSFYIVVDGKVEVFAQNPNSQTTTSPKRKKNSSRPLPTPRKFNLNMNNYKEEQDSSEQEEEEEDDDEEVDDEDEGLEGSGWQLLNRVESGGTLSSLFTILSLFTEDVKMRYEEEEQEQEEEEEQENNRDVVGLDLNDTIRKKRPSYPPSNKNNFEDADDESSRQRKKETVTITEEPEQEEQEEI